MLVVYYAFKRVDPSVETLSVLCAICYHFRCIIRVLYSQFTTQCNIICYVT